MYKFRKFDPLNPDSASIESSTFFTMWKNGHIPTNISESTASIFSKLSANWYKFCSSPRDVCKQPINFVFFCKLLNWPTSLFALASCNGMQYHLANARINSCTNASTLCQNLVKIGTAVFELKWGRKWKLCCNSVEIAVYLACWHSETD